MTISMHVPSPRGMPGSPGLLPSPIIIGELLSDKSEVMESVLLARNELLELFITDLVLSPNMPID